MSSRRRRGLCLLVPFLLIGLLGVPAATAAEEIGLSSDGTRWTPQLTVPLFEPERRWVPGDAEVRTFRLRNQGPSPASVTIEALSADGDARLAADVALSVRVDGGGWVSLDLGAPESDLTVLPEQSRRGVPVEVRAVFDPASTNPTQNLLLPLVLRITLSGDAWDVAGEGAEVGAGPLDDPGGLLPGAGATLGVEDLLVAAALCVLGALLIARRSSREEQRDG